MTCKLLLLLWFEIHDWSPLGLEETCKEQQEYFSQLWLLLRIKRTRQLHLIWTL